MSAPGRDLPLPGLDVTCVTGTFAKHNVAVANRAASARPQPAYSCFSAK